MNVTCPKCSADISSTYQEADPSVGIICGGYYCDECDHAIGDFEVERDPMPDDVVISFAKEDGAMQHDAHVRGIMAQTPPHNPLESLRVQRHEEVVM